MHRFLILLVALAALAPSAHADTALYFRGQAGDGVVSGLTRFIRPTDGFTVTATAPTSNQLYMNWTAADYGNPLGYSYRLTVTAADGQPLAPGTYTAARRWNGQQTGVPSMDFGANSSCYELTGGFVIHEMIVTGNEVTTLAIDFDQQCTGSTGAVHGQFRFNSAVPIDTTPRHILPIRFLAARNVVPGSVQISAAATISDIGVPVPITVLEGEYALDGGAFTSASGSVVNGQTIRLRATAAASPNRLTRARVDIGGYLAEFRIGTDPGPTPQPEDDPLAVEVIQAGAPAQALETRVYSPATMRTVTTSRTYPNAAEVAAIDSEDWTRAPVHLEFAGANDTRLVAGVYTSVYAFRGGQPFFGDSSFFDCDSSHRVDKMVVHDIVYRTDGSVERLAMDVEQSCASGRFIRRYTHIRIGSQLSIDYTVATPRPFKFQGVSGQTPGATVVSLPVILDGFNVPLAISCAGCEYSLGEGEFTPTAGTVSPGQSVRLRAAAAPTANTLKTVTLTVGSVAGTFEIGTATGTTPQPTGEPLVVLMFQPSFGPPTIQTTIHSPATLTTTRAFTANPGTGVEVVRNQSTYTQYLFRMTFGGPNGAPLTPGIYESVSQSSNPSQPFLYLADGGNGCGYNGIRKVVVHEIAYGSDGRVERLALDFEVDCTYGTPSRAFGRVRIASLVPIGYDFTLPRPFGFGKVMGLVPGSVATSASVVLDGFTVPLPISCTDCEYSVDGGAFTAAAGTVASGQSVRVRTTAPSIDNGVRTATLSVNGALGTFVVTTPPGASPQPNGAPLVVIYSQWNERVAGGWTRAYSPAAAGGTFWVDRNNYAGIWLYVTSPDWDNSYLQINFSGPNQTLLAPGTYSNVAVYKYPLTTASPALSAATYYNCYSLRDSQFTIHEVAYDANGRPTKLAADFVQYCEDDPDPMIGFVRYNSDVPIVYPTDTVPRRIVLPEVVAANRGVLVSSTTATVHAMNAPAAISIADGEYSIDGGAFTSVPGTVRTGQTVQVRAMSATRYNTSTQATLSIGGRAIAFRITTLAGNNSAVAADFNFDGRSDLMWRNSVTGQLYGVLMNGLATSGEGAIYAVADLNWKVAATGDFNGDGRADILYRNDATGQLYAVLLNGLAVQAEGFVYTVADLNWKVVAAGDLNGDGRSDVIYRNDATGQLYALLMNGLAVLSEGFVYTVADTNWKVALAADLNGDGRVDIVYRNEVTGQVYGLLLNGLAVQSEGFIYTVADLNWKLVFAGDFNGDGRADILYRNETTGQTYALQMNGLAVQAEGFAYSVSDLNWIVAAVGDYNGDGRADLLWRNIATGQVYLVQMNGFAPSAEGMVYTVSSADWSVVGR